MNGPFATEVEKKKNLLGFCTRAWRFASVVGRESYIKLGIIFNTT